MPKLFIQGPGGDHVVELGEGTSVLGRSSRCTIPLGDTNCSREHCDIISSGGQWIVRDRGSMNGTLLNGKKVHEQTLQAGDRITIGTTNLYFDLKPSSAGREVSSAGAETGSATAPVRESEVKRAMEAAGAGAVAAPVRTEADRQKRTAMRHAAGAEIPDYARWTKEPVSWTVKIAVPLIAAALVGAFFVAKGFFRGGETKPEEEGNLLGTNASFELDSDGLPISWKLPAGATSRIAVETGSAKHGKSCLSLQKSGEPSDLVLDCTYAEDVPLGSAGELEASVWARAEGFGGQVALKIEWLVRARTGPVLVEEYSPRSVCGADWTQVTHRFAPPEGAGAARFSVSAVGRKGRVFFDDARLRGRSGSAAPAVLRRGTELWYALSPSGSFQAGRAGRRLLCHAGFVLWSDREGGIPQSMASLPEPPVEKDLQTDFRGVLPSPVDFRDAEFNGRLQMGEETLLFACTFPTSALQQIDRVNVRLILPADSTLRGLPDNPDTGAMECAVSAGNDEFAIEFPQIIPVRHRAVPGGVLLELLFPPSSMETTSVGFQLRLQKGGASLRNPVEAAARARSEGRPGEALLILKQHRPSVRDPRLLEALDREVAVLERQERSDWEEVRAAAFRAEMAQRPDDVRQALERLSTYRGAWPGPDSAARAGPLQDLLRTLLVDSEKRSRSQRARTLLDLAQQYRSSGWNRCSREILDVIETQYGDTDAAEKARTIVSEP